ncbi:hypothetical protein DSCA_65130 [Desulfosarcina alkanivorans]|uniref:Uncharacterized protein n=1 Tax=Desulfosarcina alkanivorans TaxID=571177 RepID=A0A5K7YXA7_9BACT|nr:hypothetical protein [Desulfosarcina alkanivorans]BBO72583.1 hypothetical protein DSCA_65130 [Desulfosarcina alkanivorans]
MAPFHWGGVRFAGVALIPMLAMSGTETKPGKNGNQRKKKKIEEKPSSLVRFGIVDNSRSA